MKKRRWLAGSGRTWKKVVSVASSRRRAARAATGTAARLGVIASAAVGISTLAIPSAALASSLVPIDSAQVNCVQGQMEYTLPPIANAYPATLLSAVSTGATASFVGSTSSISPGDQLWEADGAYTAGSSPSVGADCASSAGTIAFTLYALPSAPVTFGGPLTAGESDAFPVEVPSSDEYAAEVQLEQGAIEVSAGPGTASQSVTSSGPVLLGFVTAGEPNVLVQAQPGVTAQFSLTIVPLPVEIRGLSFGSVTKTKAGVTRTATYTVTGDTRVSADVTNAKDAVVRELPGGRAGAPNINTSVAFNGKSTKGKLLPNGTYTLHLTSVDPWGNTTTASTTITLDTPVHHHKRRHRKRHRRHPR